MSSGTRIVICGGGAIGAAIAYFTSRRGARSTVIERHAVASALWSASLLFNQGNPGNRGKGNGVNVSKGSSQSARKNTASDTTEPIPNCRPSGLVGQNELIA
jgi:glycine/D-amino acid oxidase-like deaminating enzyme